MYKFNLLTKLIGVMLLQFGASTGALALDIRVSFAPESKLRNLNALDLSVVLRWRLMTRQLPVCVKTKS